VRNRPLVVYLRYLMLQRGAGAATVEHRSRPGARSLSYITVTDVRPVRGEIRPKDAKPHKHWFFLGRIAGMWPDGKIFLVRRISPVPDPAFVSLAFAATLALIAVLVRCSSTAAVVCGALAGARGARRGEMAAQPRAARGDRRGVAGRAGRSRAWARPRAGRG